MKLSKLVEKIGPLEVHAPMDAEITGVAADSRQVTPGSLFIAVRGYERDGHDFVPEAAAAGAAAVIAEAPPAADVPYILVPDSRAAMEECAAAWYGYPAKSLKVIGVTGTNGKTTVAELTRHILKEALGAKVGLIGTLHTLLGDDERPSVRTTPDALELQRTLREMADAGAEYVVMEVSSHALALGRVRGIPFKVGIFTNLTRDHLDFHITMEEYARAKSLLFAMSEKSVLNLDDPYFKVMRGAAAGEIMTYSARHDEADLTAKNIKLAPDAISFCALTTGRLCRMEMGVPGMFSVYNALAAASCAMVLGLGLEDISRALATFPGVRGRMETIRTGRGFNVIIDYAHTPDALEKVLDAVRDFTPGQVITLFGCGGDRDRTKRPIMGTIAAQGSDYVIVTSDNPRTEDPAAIIREIVPGLEEEDTPFEVILDRRRAIERAMGIAAPGDTVLLAGKGHEDYEIVGRETRHFDEREVVAHSLT